MGRECTPAAAQKRPSGLTGVQRQKSSPRSRAHALFSTHVHVVRRPYMTAKRRLAAKPQIVAALPTMGRAHQQTLAGRRAP